MTKPTLLNQGSPPSACPLLWRKELPQVTYTHPHLDRANVHCMSCTHPRDLKGSPDDDVVAAMRMRHEQDGGLFETHKIRLTAASNCIISEQTVRRETATSQRTVYNDPGLPDCQSVQLEWMRLLLLLQ